MNIVADTPLEITTGSMIGALVLTAIVYIISPYWLWWLVCILVGASIS